MEKHKNQSILVEILWLSLISEKLKGLRLGDIIETINKAIIENRVSIFYRNDKPFAWLIWGCKNNRIQWLSYGAPYGGDEALIQEMKSKLPPLDFEIEPAAQLISEGKPTCFEWDLNGPIDDILSIENIAHQAITKPNEYFESFWSVDYSDKLQGYLKNILKLIHFSKVHQQYTLGFLLSRTLPAYTYQQFSFYEKNGEIDAFLNWAWLDDARSKEYRAENFELHFQDWTGGSTLWMMELISRGGISQEIINDCKNKFLPGTKIHYFLASPGDEANLLYNSLELPVQ